MNAIFKKIFDEPYSVIVSICIGVDRGGRVVEIAAGPLARRIPACSGQTAAYTLTHTYIHTMHIGYMNVYFYVLGLWHMMNTFAVDLSGYLI